ncbi:MAG: GNAT family N-acetyltransferase [Myxococcales bacterium]|jgi:GNAT superfamily N-acetyltransferase
MQTRRITKADFDRIVEVIDRWWGGPISPFAHPIFFHELGQHALVAELAGAGGVRYDEIVGFLLGFVADPAGELNGPTGYVHLIGVHPEHRRRGFGRQLYERFETGCREAGCIRLKAITTPGNASSIRFHMALGWQAEEVDDYAGRGRRRVVLTRVLPAIVKAG